MDRELLLVITLCSSPVEHIFTGFMGLSWQEYWSESPHPSPVDHNFPELFTMTCSSWVAPHGVAYNFIDLHKPLYHNKIVIHETQLQKELSDRAKEEQGWVVDVSGGEIKVWCCKDQYCLETCNVRSMNQVNSMWSSRRWQHWTLTS